MSNLHTTKGVTHIIEEILKTSKEYVYIVSPYLKIEKQFEERFFEAIENGTKVILIYGKDIQQIDNINKSLKDKMDIYYYENLHAKFYMNENQVLITSMNLHSYSQANNRELGVQFSKTDKNDLQVMEACFKEFESIRTQSKKISSGGNSTEKTLQNFLKVPKEQNNVPVVTEKGIKSAYEYSDVVSKFVVHLQNKFPKAKFDFNDNKFSARNFPASNIFLSNSYGFITFEFDFDERYLKSLRDKERTKMNIALSKYRLYWSDPFRMLLYHEKGIMFNDANEDLKYCIEGFDLIYNEILRAFKLNV